MTEAQTETTEKKAKAEKPKPVPIKVNKNAIQVQVGPQVIAAMVAEKQAEEKAHEFQEQVTLARGEALGRLTQACYNAALADDAIKLEDVFAESKATRSALFERLYIAIGVKVPDPDGSLSYAESVKKHFPPMNATKAAKETDAYKRKDTFKKNFGTAIKKAATMALGMIQTKAVPSFDDKARCLVVKNAPKMIAGPDAGEGIETVLNGSQHEGATRKASLEAFREIAQSRAGKAPAKGKTNGTENLATRMSQSEDSFGEIINSVIGAIRSVSDNMTEAQRKHVISLRDVCNEALKV